MKLDNLGYDNFFESYRIQAELQAFDVARVITEHKDQYTVQNNNSEYEAQIVGRLRYGAEDRRDLPAVGDWVAISVYDENKALIHAVYPRKSILERRAVGKYAEEQIIATNIDIAFILQAADRDFNVNRLERYITICNTANIKPVIVITKTDLLLKEDLSSIMDTLKSRISNIPIIQISNLTQSGYQDLKPFLSTGISCCLLGSSGVGKSSLLNNLAGAAQMNTGAISKLYQKGRHTTTHRELVILDSGGILIDNPGMREVGIADDSIGLAKAFEKIEALAQNCKFTDCSHTQEKGCAILDAIQKEELSLESYKNYQKMQREKSHYTASVADKRKKDKKQGQYYKKIQNIKKKSREQ